MRLKMKYTIESCRLGWNANIVGPWCLKGENGLVVAEGTFAEMEDERDVRLDLEVERALP